MGFFSKLLGETASAPISAIGDIIDDIHTSKEEKLEAEQILYKIPTTGRTTGSSRRRRVRRGSTRPV